MKTEAMQDKRPEKKGGESLFGRIAGIAVGLAILGAVCKGTGNGASAAADGGRTERPSPPTTTWRKAETKREVFERVMARISAELESLGIAPSNVLANAKEHPTHLVRPVPEHPGKIGRVRLLVLSDEDEAKIARDYVETCRKNGRLADAKDPAGLARVERIVRKLVPVVREIGQEPEIHLLRDDSVNACCLPDGTVFVNTGMLKRIPDDDLLAAVLAHELGHAAARHCNEGISRELKSLAAGVVAEEWLANVSPGFDSDTGVWIVRALYGIGSDAVYTKPRDRRMEAEADRLGTRYLARAGYDPEAMVRLFEWFDRIAPEDREGFYQIFRSHPFHSERAEHVREVLQEPDLGQPLPPTLGERFGDWKDKATNVATNLPPVASGVATNLPPAVSGIATNVASAAAGFKTNMLSRFPKLPKKEKPTDGASDFR